jgi:Uma2 family endonuclease
MAVTRARPGQTDRQRVVYPESDGQPLAETGIHANRIIDLVAQFKRQLFWRQPDVYVGANMFMYYEEGNPRAVVAPDFFVVFGVPSEERRTLKLWLEGRPPTVIFEVTSRSTRREDVEQKRALYERLGVAEYYLFDPLREYLRPHFQGFALTAGRYQPQAPDAEGGIVSRALGVRFWPDGTRLQATDVLTGIRLLLFDEYGAVREGTDEAFALMSALAKIHMARADAEAVRADAERDRADAAAARANTERVRADAAAARADAEGARADAEADRADAAEVELTRLRAEIERLQRGA